MAQYDLAFAKHLASTGHAVVNAGLTTIAAQRTALYLGLLSIEISLKAMLEKAGIPVADIRNRSHDLANLLADLGECEVEEPVGSGRYVSAARIRAMDVSYGESSSTAGNVIEAQSAGASTYPSNVRYGDQLRHFPAEVVVDVAEKVAAFAQQHWSDIRRP